MARTRKKQNAFVAYFTPFGLKQIADFVMLVGLVLLIVGLCTTETVLLAGFICYAVAACAAIVLCVKTLVTTKNHRDPKFKNAIVNIVIMGVLFALALFGLIWSLVA